MKIISLEIENQKAIKCFQLDADGKNIEISGDAGTGKTTAISALWDILTKGKDVLSHGEKKGVIRVAIGDENATYYLAERDTTPSKSTVTISKMLGAKKLPMDLKDFESMISKLSINPHRITQMKPAERIKTLLAAAECDIDLDALDAKISEAEQDRLLSGRAAKASKPVEVPEKTEPVSVSELITKRDAIQKKNQKTQGSLTDLDALIKGRDAVLKGIKILESELADRKAEVEVANARIDKGIKWRKTAVIVSTDDLDEQISSSEEINKLAAVYEQAVKDSENHALLQSMQKEADDTVKALREQKKAALDGITWPLDGISVADGGITYNGVLLENLGESEQMLVTAAIALGDIEKHEIKVVRMDGIESMSKANYESLRDLFNERGVQVLSTRVSRGDVDDNEIVIEDGSYGVADKS